VIRIRDCVEAARLALPGQIGNGHTMTYGKTLLLRLIRPWAA